MTGTTPVILVTGASRGLGYNIAEKLLRAPCKAKVVAVARSEGGLKELEGKYPGQFVYTTGDLSDYETGVKAVKLAIEKFGYLSGIVFNAAVIAPVAKIADVNIADFKKLFDINFFSSLVTLKAAIPYLRESKGNVVFVSSEASMESHFYGWEAYGSSKACVNHLAATLAVEEPDILAFSVDPGVMDSAMQQEIREKHGGAMTTQHIEYLVNVKENGTIASTDPPATVISNMVLTGPKELNGSYHAFNSEILSPFLTA
ncbi:uncharacterized protein V1518DRAFT_413392 [Limtongia smithiae]|uniref:uncharacterized protein n=1 Tax=Limtongia smithiae TaxID=1125753 RepID=UPI0034CF9E7D